MELVPPSDDKFRNPDVLSPLKPYALATFVGLAAATRILALDR